MKSMKKSLLVAVGMLFLGFSNSTQAANTSNSFAAFPLETVGKKS